MSVKLHVLVDNNSCDERLRSEHGLSILIAGDSANVLFDTGRSAETLLHNAEVMGVDLASIEAAIVSHGHCDHTGALHAVAEAAPGLAIYAHPDAFNRRWANRPGEQLRDVSCPHEMSKLTAAGATFCAVNAPEMIADWMVLSGPIGGAQHAHTDFVIRKADEMVHDPFVDELFCLVRGEDGWILITGCCHRGLKNMLRAAKFMSHGDPIAAIVGGLHLDKAGGDQLIDAGDLLEAYGSPKIYPCHCTGDQAIGYLSRRFGDKVRPISAGQTISV